MSEKGKREKREGERDRIEVMKREAERDRGRGKVE